MALRAIPISHKNHGHASSCYKYHRLPTGGGGGGGGEIRRQPWKLRMRRVKGKTVLLLRLLQSKKRKQLKLLNFIIMVPTRVIGFYTEIVNKLISLDSACYPNIILSSQWGMPVLSHPSAACRRRVMMTYLHQPEHYY